MTEDKPDTLRTDRIDWSTVGVIATSLLTAAAWAALGYFGAKVLWLAVTTS